MPSDNNDDPSNVDFAKVFRDLQSAEVTASQLEQRLDLLDEHLDNLLRHLPSDESTTCNSNGSFAQSSDSTSPVASSSSVDNQQKEPKDIQGDTNGNSNGGS